MNPLILVTLLVAAASAAPTNLVNPAVPCAHGVAAVAYAAAPVPAALTYAVPEPVQVAVQPQITYDFPAPVSAPAPAPVAIAAPVAVAAPAPVKVEYDFPAPVSAPAPAPVAVVAPAPIVYAAPAPVPVVAVAPVHVVPHAFETRVHYAETPVVVGQTAHIMKPNLGAGAHVTNYDFMGLAQTKGAAQESYVQKSKVLAPARSVSEITPQVTVQHPTKVNVEKVAVDVPVAAPYAQPVPVPVAPQYEIHQYHHAVATPAVHMVNGVPCAEHKKTY
ncbi:calphotin-like isoform X2 [Daphnia carinata]|uniref:calphotin-like isoform X2 n=1 Tax=Daphnia carinata TaxID=120202 RepID=UPI002868BD23|nr:calphotin-like isoform X2 [Daphnia carinata]